MVVEIEAIKLGLVLKSVGPSRQCQRLYFDLIVGHEVVLPIRVVATPILVLVVEHARLEGCGITLSVQSISTDL